MPKKVPYEISKNITFSTGHISEETNLSLGNPSPDSPFEMLSLYEYEYGHRIHIDEEMSDTDTEIDTLIKIAIEQDCQWLILDRDGPTFDHLPTFDW